MINVIHVLKKEQPYFNLVQINARRLVSDYLFNVYQQTTQFRFYIIMNKKTSYKPK